MPSDHQTTLLGLAGEAVYQRGADYFADGRVTRLTTQGERTSATVVGSEPYRVTLRTTARGYDGSCSCPASEGFDFCKHCVAAALALEARQAQLDDAASAGPAAAPPPSCC